MRLRAGVCIVALVVSPAWHRARHKPRERAQCGCRPHSSGRLLLRTRTSRRCSTLSPARPWPPTASTPAPTSCSPPTSGCAATLGPSAQQPASSPTKADQPADRGTPRTIPPRAVCSARFSQPIYPPLPPQVSWGAAASLLYYLGMSALATVEICGAVEALDITMQLEARLLLLLILTPKRIVQQNPPAIPRRRSTSPCNSARPLAPAGSRSPARSHARPRTHADSATTLLLF